MQVYRRGFAPANSKTTRSPSAGQNRALRIAATMNAMTNISPPVRPSMSRGYRRNPVDR